MILNCLKNGEVYRRIFIRTYRKKNRQIVEIHKVIYSTFKAAIHT